MRSFSLCLEVVHIGTYVYCPQNPVIHLSEDIPRDVSGLFVSSNWIEIRHCNAVVK